MMKKSFSLFNDRTNLFLFFLCTILLFIFVISFTGKNKGKKSFKKTVLVNPTYKDSISFFELKCGEAVLSFEKKNGIWFCGNRYENFNGNSDYTVDEFFIPCIPGRVEGFLRELSEIRTLEKISGTKKSLADDLGLSEEEGFFLRYPSENGIHEICFGDKNFSGSGRYMTSENFSDLYILDSSFDKYLYASVTQWADPYLISKAFGNYSVSDIQNKVPEGILNLRHGGISLSNIHKTHKPFRVMNIEMGDTSFFELNFYELPENENSIHVYIKYVNPLTKIESEYCVRISEWTYNKLD